MNLLIFSRRLWALCEETVCLPSRDDAGLNFFDISYVTSVKNISMKYGNIFFSILQTPD